MKRRPVAGDEVLFVYPPEYTDFSEYRRHSGQVVIVERELAGGDERMYRIRASDGWTGHAWESELALLEDCGCCGARHPEGFDGDCRDDANRF